MKGSKMKTRTMFFALLALMVFGCNIEVSTAGDGGDGVTVYAGTITDSMAVTFNISYSVATPRLLSTSAVITACQYPADTTRWFEDSAFYAVPDSGVVVLRKFSKGCALGNKYRVTIIN